MTFNELNDAIFKIIKEFEETTQVYIHSIEVDHLDVGSIGNPIHTIEKIRFNLKAWSRQRRVK